ncbi:MAG: MBL fold metallo-hydrolase [Bdellovibrionales bacterium]
MKAGTLEIKAIHTPGHTPACASYLVNNKMVFTGDALFMPDFGVGRTDFPGGSTEDLYNSIFEKLYRLPDDVIVYTGHDYMPNGRELKFQSTIGEEKSENIQLNAKTEKEEFIKFRESRNKKLAAPRLLLPSIQVNIKGGNMPKAEDNGMMYLKIPLTPAK